jgi:hypothetical protein
MISQSIQYTRTETFGRSVRGVDVARRAPVRTKLAVAGGVTAALLLASLAGCGDDDDRNGPCTPGSTAGCAEGLVCEPVRGGDPTCVAPLEMRGRVFDAATRAGIAGAHVVALDADGAARSTVVSTASDGSYRLPLSIERQADGSPLAESVTLRVSAQGYQPFPTPPRVPLPIALGSGTLSAGVYVVQNAATDVALVALPGDTDGLGTISGRVVSGSEGVGAVLVLAEPAGGGAASSSALTDTSGAFTLFNVPTGPTTVRGYRGGLVVTPAEVTVTTSGVRDVLLEASAEGTGTVTGTVQFVNAGGFSRTSVILVVRSTFVETVARGEAPLGLRQGDVTGAFSIPGVPPGEYAVLAAFENDGLVRDPDTSIAGTDIVFVTVPPGGGTVAAPSSFKITEALAVRSPGADGPEVVTTPTPEFVWADDSGERSYVLHVYDAFGALVYEAAMLPAVSGSRDVRHRYAGPALTPGMFYQFKAWSISNSGSRLSTTEDLRGVFVYEPSR